MHVPQYPLPADIEASLTAFLGPDTSPASFLLVSETSASLPRNSVDDRLNGFRLLLEEQLRTVIANANEVDDPSYSLQVRGELIATLIVLRDLWAAFPELWPSLKQRS